MSGPTDAIPLRRSPTDLVSVLTGTIETLQAQARALDVTLTIDAEPGLPRANVDAEKIAWAVATLVGNAFRYVRRGTRRLPGGSIHVRLRAAGASIVVSVEDDGPGIPADKVANLFRRGHGVTHGTGLALMLIEDVVTAHGGTVDVKSKCDAFASGTIVTLRLPANGAAPGAPPA
jgi:signal transduction histidine kinase